MKKDFRNYFNQINQIKNAIPSSVIPILAFDLMPSSGDLSLSESYNLNCSRGKGHGKESKEEMKRLGNK